MSVLDVQDLAVSYGKRRVLHGVSLQVAQGACYGLVGESGCGKSTMALALLRALPRGGRVDAGRMLVAGRDVAALTGAPLRAFWAETIAMVYQDPSRALNPVMTIAAQLRETPGIVGAGGPAAALDQVRIANAARVLGAYPYELSGGMQQRVVIAMALARRPALLVLDEPTTGLDATVEADILDLVDDLRRQTGTAVLLISHNLPVVGRMADRIGVLYAGVLVEEGPAQSVLGAPRHPYADRLLRCLPRRGLRKQEGALETIPGSLPPLGQLPPGCVFMQRCQAAQPVCSTTPPWRGTEGHSALCHFDPPFARPEQTATAAWPAPGPGAPALQIADTSKTYRGGRDLVRAVAAVSFSVPCGETLGLIGESGSGKTTLARLMLGLEAPDAGGVVKLDGRVVAGRTQARSPVDRKALQMIFQNPDSALNRAQRVRTILARPFIRLAGLDRAALQARLSALADGVRLSDANLEQRPRALSGGLKQRVAIARAFAGEPQVVICDEPTSALDVSVQAAILNLLTDLQRRTQVSYVFISHDLNVVRYMADQVVVLYRGRVMESGRADAVFGGPNHPYTAALLAAAPSLDDTGHTPRRMAGNGRTPQQGCLFQFRCPCRVGPICDEEEPALGGAPHAIRCHIPAERLAALQREAARQEGSL